MKEDLLREMAEHEIAALRAEQAQLTMPLIGPLLDEWEQISNDLRSEIEEERPGPRRKAPRPWRQSWSSWTAGKPSRPSRDGWRRSAPARSEPRTSAGSCWKGAAMGETLTIETSEAVAVSLNELVATGLFGATVEECAEQLLRERLREVGRVELGRNLSRFYSFAASPAENGERDG